MEPLYTLYLDHYADFWNAEDSAAKDRTPLERAAALALARYHHNTNAAPLTFYEFGLAWDRLRNTATVT